MKFRRRIPRLAPDDAGALRSVLGAVERGKHALTGAVPRPRDPGRPLADALLEFEGALADAGSHMAGWRAPEAEVIWGSCDRALSESSRMAERLRLEAPQLDFEGLVMAVKDLLAPLEAFEDAGRLLPRHPGR